MIARVCTREGVTTLHRSFPRLLKVLNGSTVNTAPEEHKKKLQEALRVTHHFTMTLFTCSHVVFNLYSRDWRTLSFIV